MIEPLGENIHAHAKVDPLDVSKGLPQAVSTVVAREIDGSCPGLHQGVDRTDSQGLVVTFPGSEEIIVIFGFDVFQVALEDPVYIPVHEKPVCLAAARLTYVEGFSYIEIPYLSHFEMEDITYSEAAVYADGEEEKIARIGGKEFSNACDSI